MAKREKLTFDEIQDKFTFEERQNKNFNNITELPRTVFSRPEIPFRCEVRRHKNPIFPPLIVCSFEDYVPAYKRAFEDELHGRGYKFETIKLFFPRAAKYLMPPHKIHPREEYEPFNVHDRHYLHTRFITRFSYMSDIKDKTDYLDNIPVYKKLFEEYANDNIEDSYLFDEARYRVRKIVAYSPVVRINEKKEIIDGLF